MSRGFAIIVSTLGAFAAQAQATKGAEPAEVQSTAVVQEEAERPVMLASRTAPVTSSVPAPSSARDGANAVARKSTATELVVSDCSVVATYLAAGTLAVRTYEAPPDTRINGWKRAPYVAAVARCGQLYILQMKSMSQDAWIIRQARLEAPGGVVLQVEALRSTDGPRQDRVNVIVARAPADKKVPRLKLDLSGEDGRVARLEVEELP